MQNIVDVKSEVNANADKRFITKLKKRKKKKRVVGGSFPQKLPKNQLLENIQLHIESEG